MSKPPPAVDITVIGGGTAGLAAAITAARAGARTVLLERFPMLGGMGTTAGVHTFCGLFHPDTSKPAQWLNPGLPEEIGRKMLAHTGDSGPQNMSGLYVLRQAPAFFSKLAHDLCTAEPQLTLSLNTPLVSAQDQDDHWLLRICQNGNETELTSRRVIDTSGDAALASSTQRQSNQGILLHRPAYIAIIGGLPAAMDWTDALRLQLAGHIVKGIQAKQLPPLLTGVTFRPSTTLGEAHITLDLEADGADWNPQDSAHREAQITAAQDALTQLWQHLRAHHPLFASSTAPIWPLTLGVRESARWKGDYLLTADDLLHSRRFPDEVALAGWPMEMRETARGPRFRHFLEPKPAGIPARSLFRSAQPHLWFAGRCLSADHEALASVRVMGTCLATGQAAGRLAVASL
jgi:hypothetical protein